MMLRVPVEGLASGRGTLPVETGRYVTRVHRLGVGDRFVAFDPEARLEAEAEVVAVGRRVEVAVGDVGAASHVAMRSITLVQSLSKGTKVDAVVRDATELGVTRMVVARAERSVKRGGDGARWRRVALEAARQCGRGDLPAIEGPVELAGAWSEAGDVKLLLDADGEVFPTMDPEASVVIAVGPEGGFSEPEKEAAQAAGFVTVRLGPFVMRTETACAAALGALHRG